MSVKEIWIKLRRGPLVTYTLKVLFILAGKLPVKRHTVIFESFHGKQYSDNPRAIYEYMKANCPGLQLYWSADRRYGSLFQKENIPYLRRFSLKWIMTMARARYWVINTRLPLWMPKPKHTIYLQTWHGTPLKRLAADMDEVHMPGTDTKKYKENFLYAASKWDYLVSPNAYSTEIFKRAFGFKKTVIESGYPRNDFLVNANTPETIEKIKKTCGLPMDKKVMLYAPTWRDNEFYSVGKYKFNLQLDLEQLQSALGDDYVIVLRLHYLVAERLDLSGYEGFVYDFSHHEDIRELYLIADMLITDYSSVFFDYSILQRPMLFFVYDIDSYRDSLRGFYFDFEEKAPGPLLKTTPDIIAAVKEIEANGFAPVPSAKAFYDKFCYLEDGHASKRVVDAILE